MTLRACYRAQKTPEPRKYERKYQIPHPRLAPKTTKKNTEKIQKQHKNCRFGVARRRSEAIPPRKEGQVFAAAGQQTDNHTGSEIVLVDISAPKRNIWPPPPPKKNSPNSPQTPSRPLPSWKPRPLLFSIRNRSPPPLLGLPLPPPPSSKK